MASTEYDIYLYGPGFRLSGGRPAAVVCSADDTPVTLETSGKAIVTRVTRREPIGGPVEEITRKWTLAGGGHQLAWTVGTLGDGSGWTIRAAFRNGADEPVRLREVLLLQTAEDGLTVEGDPANWLLTTIAGNSRRVATLSETLISANDEVRREWDLPDTTILPTDERSNDGRWRRFADFAILACNSGKKALAIGAVGPPEADVRIDCRVDGPRIRLEIACEMTDVIVPPGAWRAGQQVVLLQGEHDAIVERLMRWCAATHGARTHRGPESGWCSYYHFYNDITAADAIAMADHVRETGLNMPVIQIDAGFERGIGDWELNDKFSGGWKPVVESIEAAGSTPGIWLGPLMVHESLPLFQEHPEWFQHTADGRLIGDDGVNAAGTRWLDPTHPDAAACIRSMIRRLHAAGFRYFKFDFNCVGPNLAGPVQLRLHDPSKTRFQALRDLFGIYRDAIGEECYLLACIAFSRAVVGYADSTRIGPDTGPVWDAGHLFSLRELIRVCGQTAPANGILFANDPDVMYVRPRGKLDLAETRTWTGFVGLLGGTVMTSDPLWIDDRICGTVSVALDGENVRLRAKIIDAKVERGNQPWAGSSIDFYVDLDGQARQIWIEPAADGHAASILHRADGAIVALPEAVSASWPDSNGYRIEAEIPLRSLGVPDDAPCIKWEFKAAVKTDPAEIVRAMATVFGTTNPWERTTGYGTLYRGQAVSLKIGLAGWRSSERHYQILVPPAPERGLPLAPGDPEHSRFGFIARRPWGDFGVVQIYNPAGQVANMVLDVACLMGYPCHVWSFWDGRYHGVHERFVARGLESHASMILRLTPVDNSRPVVIGSDLHISCGAAEIESLSDDRINLNGAGAPAGSLWLAWRGDLRAGAPAERVDEDIWRLEIRREPRHGASIDLRYPSK